MVCCLNILDLVWRPFEMAIKINSGMAFLFQSLKMRILVLLKIKDNFANKYQNLHPLLIFPLSKCFVRYRSLFFARFYVAYYISTI
jgi:hypothetical protein